MISEEAHLILPYHRRIDIARDRVFKIGTTGRGIGPAYEDKVARYGIRMVDLMDEEVFREKLESQPPPEECLSLGGAEGGMFRVVRDFR